MLGESRKLGGDPVVNEDHAGIGIVQRAQHRRPVLHRKLDVGDRADRPGALRFGNSLLHRLGDHLGVGDLFLHDVDLVVLRLPRACGDDLVQIADEAVTVPGLRTVDLEDVLVFRRIRLDEFERRERRIAVQIGHLGRRRGIHRRLRNQHEGGRDGVDLLAVQRLDRSNRSLGRHNIDIDNFGAKFAALDAAGSVDLVDADGQAVQPILVIADADRRGLCGRNPDQDIIGRFCPWREGRQQRRADGASEKLATLDAENHLRAPSKRMREFTGGLTLRI